MTDAPNSIEDYPEAIEDRQVQLAETTRQLEKRRRQKRRMKTNFKMEAREANEPSNRTERKNFVKKRKESSGHYQTTQEKIDELSMEQARLKGRLQRLRGELDLHLQTQNSAEPALP